YDAAVHLRWLSRAFADPRYAAIDGRPLFLVYSVQSIPEPQAVIETWREEAHRIGIPDPFLCAVLGPGSTSRVSDLMKLGFDGVTEFYPRGHRARAAPLEGAAIDLYRRLRRAVEDQRPRSRPAIQSYQRLVDIAMRRPLADGEGVF